MTPNNFKGFAIVYNATTWAIDKVVTWESTQGGDIPADITAKADGGFVLVGQTLGSLGGFTNPAVGTNDGYIEVYDATGTLSWKFQTETTVADNFGDATVDSDGSIYVSGNSNGDPTLWKFTSGGTLVWSSTIDNSGTIESQRDHGGDKNGIFYLSSHNRSGAGGLTWPNTIAYVPQGTDDNLLQKLSPGDFNADKFVDFADVQIAGTATKPGLPGDDTYDFNGDGDSTLADTTYMITNIMERIVGDIAQDTLVTDVDNADIGRAIGASGVGTLYLDGDMDWDADVDSTDITAVAAAFTGAKKPGKWTNGSSGATLRYRASDGQVWLHADEAAGGIITSFQLENAAGTFVPANYTGPTGGSFGGALEDDTTIVLADTDLTLAGTTGLVSLGTVFPTGMDLAGLTAYLKTAVYTGQPGSGQMQFTLVVGDLLGPYDSWTTGFGGLTDAYANIDFDGGGLETGIEWIVGGDPTDASDDAGNAPTLDNSDPNSLKFVFKRRDAAAADSNTTIVVEYGSDLTGWRNTAVHGLIDGVTTDDSVDLGGGFHQVTVSIPKSLAVGGKLFARLGISGLPFSLFGTDFENDNGGSTVDTTSGSDWVLISTMQTESANLKSFH